MTASASEQRAMVGRASSTSKLARFGESTLAFRIAIAAVVLLRFWLMSSQGMQEVGWMVHDDTHFIVSAESILQGQWLGPYNQFTLIKGPGYPLWIAAVCWTGISSPVADQILYCLSCAAVLIAVRPAVRSRWMRFSIFTILLLHPAGMTIHRFLREQIYFPLTLVVMAAAIGLLFRRDWPLRQMMPWLVLLGVSSGYMWITREEGIWITPTLGLAMVIIVMSVIASRADRWLTTSIAILAVPLAIIFSITLTVCLINQNYYGLFCITEMKEPAFTGAMGSLQGVEQQEFQRYIVVPKETRERIYQVSPAFAELRDLLEGKLGRFYSTFGAKIIGRPEDNDAIAGGWFMWCFRDAVALKGHARTARQAMDFYQRIANEINAAILDGRLKGQIGRSSLAPPWRWEYLPLVCQSFAKSLKMSVLLEDLSTKDLPSNIRSPELELYRDVSGEARAAQAEGQTNPLPFQAYVAELKETCLSFLLSAYRCLVPVLLLLGSVGLAIDIARNFRSRKMPVESVATLLLLLAVAARCTICAVIDVTTFPALLSVYLGPCYLLLAMAASLAATQCLTPARDGRIRS